MPSGPRPRSWRPVRRELVFCLCSGDVASIVGYLSAIAAGHAVALLDAAGAAPSSPQALIDRYRPAFIVRSGDRADTRDPSAVRRSEGRRRPADELAVLLSTSGTTGSPKLVRLAHRNIEANATSIAEYLEIDEHERAIQSLPIHYSYGLSVLNSHLASRGERDPDAALDHAAGLLGRRCALAGHVVRRRALLVRHPRTHRTPAQGNARDDADPDTGRRPPSAGVDHPTCTS